MNEKMMEIFARNIIASLPNEKKELYLFIESIEDSLAEQSQTKDQFLALLKEYSPHHQAANHFHLTIEKTVKLIHEIEDEISRNLEKKMERYKWIDYTEKMTSHQGDQNKQYFLLVI